MNRLFIAIVAFIIILLFVANTCFFVVDQRQFVVPVELGNPGNPVTEPGLYFRTPFVQIPVYFDRRILDLETPPREIYTRDQKTLIIDNYAKWRIKDPLKVYKSFKDPLNPYDGRSVERNAISRIDDNIFSALREELGKWTLTEIVSEKRRDIMAAVAKKASMTTEKYGLEIVDVRIKRADLPRENARHVFERMRTYREREAKEYRSQGEEEALKIRAMADKEATITITQAEMEARKIQGEGDAEAARIYAEAYSKDPEFYRFWRTLEAYRTVLKDRGTLVLTPDSEFFSFFKSITETPRR